MVFFHLTCFDSCRFCVREENCLSRFCSQQIEQRISKQPHKRIKSPTIWKLWRSIVNSFLQVQRSSRRRETTPFADVVDERTTTKFLLGRDCALTFTLLPVVVHPVVIVLLAPYYSDATVFEKFCFLKCQKPGVFTFVRFEGLLQRPPFSWWISMDGRPNLRNKAAFSNFSGVMCGRCQNHSIHFWNVSVVLFH